MASARANVGVGAPADEIWEVIGGFGSLPDWMPTSIPKSTLAEGGRVRHLTTSDGRKIVERLERYDRSARTYSYSIVQAPFPVSDYLAKISVTADSGGKACHVEWAATFTPVGVSAEEAHKLFQQIFLDGLGALVSRYASKP